MPFSDLYNSILGGLFPANDSSGFISPEQQRAAQQQGLINFGVGLLANSGTNQGFGQRIGEALQAGQAASQGSINNQLQQVLLRSQIAKNARAPAGGQDPDLVREYNFAQTKGYQGSFEDFIKLKQNQGDGIGNVNPGQYDPGSVQAYKRSKTKEDPLGDFSLLKPYVPPAQPTVQVVNGVPTVVQPSRTGAPPIQQPLSNLPKTTAAAEALNNAQATGTGTGQAIADQRAKAPASASFDYIAGELEKQIPNTMQGGFLGVSGALGSIFDRSDKQLFNNQRQQLSTELRTIFRIPGEGSLSDKEQAQYGLQLPDTGNSDEVNKKILDDLRQRVRLRLQTPIGGPSTPAAPANRPPLSSFRR